MTGEPEEDRRVRAAALRNAQSIFLARQRSERDLLETKEALRKSEELLRSVTDATPALIAYLDTDCRYRFVNQQFAVWFERPQEQFLDVHMREVVGEEAFARLQPHLARALDGEDVEFETMVPYRHAGPRFVKVTYHPDRAEDGLIRGIFVLVIDISESKRTEAALRQAENRLLMAMDAGQMGAWEWNIAKGEVHWSPTLEAIHGLETGTFGGGFEDFQRDIHPDDRARVLESIQACVERRDDYRIEYRIIKPDGTESWIEARGKLLLDEQGQPERLTGLCMDVTPRKHAEKRLRQSERFNRTIIESSRDSIHTLTRDGVLIWTNRVGLETLGVNDAAAIEGKSWFELWEGENRELAEAAVRAAATGGTGTFVGSVSIEGQTTWWDVAVTPIVDSAGKPERLLAVSRDATERRKFDEIRARLAAVVEFSDDAIVTKSLDGIIATWNKGAERMFGYTAAEMIGKPVTLLIPPDCEDEEPEILSRVKRGKVVEPYETVRRRKDGSLLNVSLTVSPIKDSTGRIIGASKIARDITQRKRMEAERARHASVLEKSLNEIYIFDTEKLRFQYVNEGALRNLGYSMDAMRHMTPVDLKPDFTEARFRKLVEPLLQRQEEKLIFCTRHQRADGSLYPVEVHLQCVTRAGINVFLAIILDITERRKAEAERERLLASEQLARDQAEQSEKRARFLAEASASLAATLDYEVTLTKVARASVPDIADWCAIHILEPDGGIRVVATAHFDPAKRALAKQLQERYPEDPESPFGMPAVIRSGEPLLYPEISDDLLVATTRDSEHLELVRSLGLKSAIIVPLVANAKTLGAITLVTAESERRFSEADLPFAEDLAARVAAAAENARLYQEVRHANASKDHFMAVLSHELRTPLNPVLMTVTDLERDESVPAHLREQMTVLRRNVELEARLIDDLLDSTRIANGKLQLQRTVVDARELLRRAIAIVEGEAQAKGVSLSATSSAAACPVNGDPARLQQVFWNVIKNAVKFTPEGGSVRVSCESTNHGTLRVSVTDTGVGIVPEDAAKIFNAFEQGAVGMTHGFGGLGLGLAISNALVTMHDGTLTADSAGRDKGATFTIELPLTQEIPIAARRPVPAPGPRPALRILIVEDHEATANVMARLLKKRGYVVSVASSVSSALEVVRQVGTDLLISDLGLPDGTGQELMQKLRSSQKVIGIALSGYGTEADVAGSRKAGFSVHLTKPVDIERLDQEIQSLAGRA